MSVEDQINEAINTRTFKLRREFPYQIHEHGVVMCMFRESSKDEAEDYWETIKRSTGDPGACLEMIDEDGESEFIYQSGSIKENIKSAVQLIKSDIEKLSANPSMGILYRKRIAKSLETIEKFNDSKEAI